MQLKNRTKNKSSRKRKNGAKCLIEAPTVNVVQMPQAAGEKFMQKGQKLVLSDALAVQSLIFNRVSMSKGFKSEGCCGI